MEGENLGFILRELVQAKGLEPLRYSASDPKSDVSANFTILAYAQMVGLEPTTTDSLCQKNIAVSIVMYNALIRALPTELHLHIYKLRLL